MKSLHLRLAMSEPIVLQQYLRGTPLSFAEFKRQLFLSERRIDWRIPDHFYRLTQSHNFEGIESFRCLFTTGLPRLANSFLQPDESRPYVEIAQFEAWQTLVTRMSSLLLTACAMFKRAPVGALEACNHRMLPEVVREQFAKSTVLSARHRSLDDLIASKGLADLHVHLNGSTEMDYVWLNSLILRRQFLRALVAGYRKNSAVRELYEQIETGLTPGMVGDRLRVARRLRIGMCERLFGEQVGLPADGLVALADLRRGTEFVRFDDRYHVERHPLRHRLDPEPPTSETQCEALFLLCALEHLSREPDEDFASALHCYLTIQGATFIPLTVQQCEQVGFDQFQKITLDNVRDPVEMQHYYERFVQASYSAGQSDLRLLEGRFAPKSSARETARLLSRIVRGLDLYRQKGTPSSPAGNGVAKDRLDLRLVAHFIKKDELSEHKPATFCRFYRLRRSLERQARALVQVRGRLPDAAHFVTGVDGASNELHTPPEVFAPAFRYVRRNGIPHATFHVGEDFRHLLGGIRAIWEAVTFLELQPKDRIGHGIAVGIDPLRWLDAMPAIIVLPKGEWLDDLVFARFVLKDEEGVDKSLLGKIERVILPLAMEVYDLSEARPSLLDDLAAAWMLRQRDPLVYLDPHVDKQSGYELCVLDHEALAERQRINKAKNSGFPSELYRSYHKAQTVKRWLETIEVEADFLPEKTLRSIQERCIKLLNDHRVAIEMLPSSNVRISHYAHYRDHHMVRWLLANGGQAPRPTVCVGSDDPGIFVTNMRNEFMHIYLVLKERVLNEAEAMRILHELNKNASEFAFRSCKVKSCARCASHDQYD